MDLSRFELIAGPSVYRLQEYTVDLFGVGGVGSAALEVLCRSGVGTIRIYDFDTVSPSNINRQLIATTESMGMPKVEAALKRCRTINPDVDIVTNTVHLAKDTIASSVPEDALWSIDAIDEIQPKAALLEHLHNSGTTFISSMGAGNRLDPAGVHIKDLSETSGCPLARIMRKEMKSRGITKGIPVVVTDAPIKRYLPEERKGDRTTGSSPWLPGIFGFTAAAWLVQRMLEENLH
jgi:tRNA threonylcarbamoyladenosine dehydratase